MGYILQMNTVYNILSGLTINGTKTMSSTIPSWSHKQTANSKDYKTSQCAAIPERFFKVFYWCHQSGKQ